VEVGVAVEKRVSKKRVSKKRVSKKRVSKKRASAVLDGRGHWVRRAPCVIREQQVNLI
jgi:hypothetical protein